jgi:tetratricopeptide (TPR) repeat protein
VRYFNLASCYLYLFYAHFEKHHFALALEYLESTAYEDPYFYKAYAHLGRLYLVGAKLWRDVHCLKESIRNFTKYAHSNKLSSAIVAEWAEALTYLGTHEEDLTLLHQAEELIQKALPFAPDAPHLWYAHGFVLYEQGRYFSDQKFFHLAIEKLEKGLELDPKNGSLWYQLALARFSLAEETENLALAKDALGCFANVKEGMNLRFGSFWNLWGVVLLHVAEETRDIKKTPNQNGSITMATRLIS